MKKISFYLSKHYIKNFLIITFFLSFVTVLIDFLQNINSFEGFNRVVLYLFYRFEDYLSFIYPLSIIFGAVWLFFNLIEKNYLIILESFSYSKKDLIKPIILSSIIIYLIFIALNFTNFAYANTKADEIKFKNRDFDTLNNLFFKYNNSFVFAKKLDIVNKKFNDVTLYKIKNYKIDSIYSFKEANFNNNRWIAKNIEIKKIKYNNSIPIGYDIKTLKSKDILKGYFPKVIKLLYEGKRMNISDGIKAYILSKSQNIDTSKVLSALFSKILTPLFSIFLIIIIFFNLPNSKRFFNKSKFLIYSIGLSLIVWTLLYSINILSLSGTINPLFGIPFIIFLLFIISLWYYFKSE